MEDQVQTQAIPLTYDELENAYTRAKALANDLGKANERLQQNVTRLEAEFSGMQGMLRPLVSYISEQLLDSNAFQDAIADHLEVYLQSRESQDIIESIVEDALGNVSIELNTRRR